MSATIESDAEDPPAWDASFGLNFYTDANFTNELNAGIILLFTGFKYHRVYF